MKNLILPLLCGVILTVFGAWIMLQDLPPLPEDPMAGARLFQEKGCVQCHSIDNDDARIGPNLSRVHLKGSLLDIAGSMWNHAPLMQQYMAELRISPPELTAREMANLTAFLTAYQYYLKQLGRPGDPERGRQVFESKNCGLCHSLQPDADPREIGPNLHGYSKLSPIQIAQAMWNHEPAMAEEFIRLGLPLPTFEKDEMADLIAYLQRAAVPADAEPVYVEPGSPNQGRALFEEKDCATCHAIRGEGGTPGIPDLGQRRTELVRSVTEVAAFMWDHGVAMQDKMQELNVPQVRFEGNEMADIIAYLYFINYFDQPGNIQQGRELFTEKGCIHCHSTTPGKPSIGPDLSQSDVVGSPIEVITAMWNHAKLMEPAMAARGIPWPRFEMGEMTHLVEFIRAHRDSSKE